ncbi:MAG: hypothetical protein KGZ35_01335 [Truepera sp.]|nr:hypothetical protein [Truepera sp.]
MSANFLRSLTAYSQFVAELLARPLVERSTVSVWSASQYSGIAEGDVWFRHGFRLRIREEIDFDGGLITAYGYEVYQGQEKIYWYDDFPHPQDPTLASTHPHHKHVPPNIKRNRIPAPGLSFEHPNLRQIIAEVEELVSQAEEDA